MGLGMEFDNRFRGASLGTCNTRGIHSHRCRDRHRQNPSIASSASWKE
jgi:hypothetical protein